MQPEHTRAAIPPRPTSSKRQIAGLDLLRALAAALVFCFHLGFWIWMQNPIHPAVPAPLARFEPLFSQGWIGVEVFFVLSGFVIAYSSERVTPLRFMQHRSTRLLPAAFLCATCTGIVLLTAYPLREVALEWVKSITLFPVGPWVDGSYWTLPIECAFYLLVLFVLLLSRGDKLPEVMAVLGIVSSALCVLAAGHGSASHTVLPVVTLCSYPPGACLLLLFGVFFALGVLLHAVLLRRSTGLRLTALLACVPGCLAEVLWHGTALAKATRTPDHPVLSLALFAGAVLALVVCVRANEAIRRLLGDRGLILARQAGLITYPFYLLHAQVGGWIIRTVYYRGVGYGAGFLVAGLLIAGCSGVIALAMEPRLRAGMDRLWRRQEAGARPLARV